MSKKEKQPKFKNPKKQKKLIILLSILFSLLAILGGTYFYLQKHNISFSQAKTKITSLAKKSTKKQDKTKKPEQTQIKIKKVSYTAYNWNALNLRNKPDGQVIGGINKDSILIVSEEISDSWLKVKVADKEGYVATKYTKDKNGYFRQSFKTKNLTNQCKKLINSYFTKDEQKILNEYEFRYIPNWIADCGAGTGNSTKSFNTNSPKVLYFRDGTFKTASSHDEILLHEMCHVLFPENNYSLNSPFANRLKVAGYDAGLKKVPIHTSKNKCVNVSTGR